MFIDTNSIEIKVGNGNYINIGQYLIQATYGFNKLWGNDSGRNLAGKMTGTLLGIFPKITLQFRKLTKSEVELIVKILDSPLQTVKYYDPNKKAKITMETYTGDYEIVNRNIISNATKADGFTCSFIATDKRV